MKIGSPVCAVSDCPVQYWDNDDVEEPAGHADLNQDRVELQVVAAPTGDLPGDEPEYGGGDLRDVRSN